MTEQREAPTGQECQDCKDAPATHVCQMMIGGIPAGLLYVCEDCYPEPEAQT